MSDKVKKSEGMDNYLPSVFSNYFGDHLFKEFFKDSLPATNVKETKKNYTVELAIPGFEKDEIEIEVDNNVLTVSAMTESSSEEKGEDEKVLRQEFKSSSFSRSFTLPEGVDTENISAKQKQGILQIKLPKLENAKEDKIKKIAIK